MRRWGVLLVATLVASPLALMADLPPAHACSRVSFADMHPPDPDIVIEPPASTASIVGRAFAVVALAAAAALALPVRRMRRRPGTTA
jgi:hypothetical protein